MKRCPQCPRTYADDLNFCLDDGAVLVRFYDDEATLVNPQPAPQPKPKPPAPTPLVPPAPVPPTPAPEPIPETSGSSLPVVGIVVAAAVVILLLLLAGGIIGFLSYNREQSAQSYNSSPTPIATATPGLNSSPTPPCQQSPLGCASPTPTASVAPSPGPSPSANPSASPSASTSPAEPAVPTLSTGTYQAERTGDIEGHATTIRLQLTINSDGTYFQQGYATLYGTAIKDQLIIEEKGSYSQEGEILITKDRQERSFNITTQSWDPWKVPSGGSSDRDRIRNVTPTTFQVYEKSEKKWYTFAKM